MLAYHRRRGERERAHHREGNAHRAFAPEGDEVVLIRPDGHIAARRAFSGEASISDLLHSCPIVVRRTA